MVRGVAWGIGTGLSGREAATGAIQQAMSQVGTGRPVLAIVFVSQEFDVLEVLNSLAGLLGSTPVWGFSTVRPLTAEGEQPRSVVIALISGNELKAQVLWWPTFAQDGQGTARQVAQMVPNDLNAVKGLLIAADGISGNSSLLCGALQRFSFPIGGGLASGEYQLGRTYQLGGTQCGPGGLAVAVLGGRFRLGIGSENGWQDVGLHFKISRVRDVWLQLLGDGTPAETYSQIFGYPVREWGFPPLSELARLYPLGIEVSADRRHLILRSPLHVQVDGSFRMNAPVKEGQMAHLMVGDPVACQAAAQRAVKQALLGLGSARPLLALVLVDIAWSFLFGSRSGQFIEIVRAALGETPMLGAYTLGQINQPSSNSPPVVYNQNLQVILLGEEQ